MICNTHGMGVRKKRARGFKKEARQGGQVSPLNPLSVAPRVRLKRVAHL
jgi:hypothetical protein